MMIAGGVVNLNEAKELAEIVKVFYIVERVKRLIHRS